MTHECTYCKTAFYSTSSLNNHLRTAKYCLSLRVPTSEIGFTCEICDKNFSTKPIHKKHYDVCSSHVGYIKYKQLHSEAFERVKQLEINEQKLMKQLEINEQKLEKQILDFKQSMLDLTVHAMDRPSVVNNTNNSNNVTNVLNLAPFDAEAFGAKVEYNLDKFMTPQHILDGHKGLASLVFPCLKNDDNKMIYNFSDTSRGNCKFKDAEGNIVKDNKGYKLAKIVEPLAVAKSKQLVHKETDALQLLKQIHSLRNLKDERRKRDEYDIDQLKGYEESSSEYKHIQKRLYDRMREQREDDEKLEDLILQADREEINIDDPVGFREDNVSNLFSAAYTYNNLSKDSSKFVSELSVLS